MLFIYLGFDEAQANIKKFFHRENLEGLEIRL